MEPIPMEWVDRIFSCMAEFYGERWNKYFAKPHLESFYKMTWKNGLNGLTKSEIKNALVLCRRHAVSPTVHPPHVMEFYHYGKSVLQPDINYRQEIDEKKRDPEVAKKALSDIKKRLGMPVRMQLYGTLSA